MSKDIVEVESIKKLGDIFKHPFHDRKLLLQALTHQSAINEEHPNAGAENYRSLAFVGDAALKHVIAVTLFTRKNIGIFHVEDLHNETLSKIMNKNLANTARKLKLELFMVRGNGERSVRNSMFASCLEAILGVIAIECQGNDCTLFRVANEIFELTNWIEELEKELKNRTYQGKNRKNKTSFSLLKTITW